MLRGLELCKSAKHLNDEKPVDKLRGDFECDLVEHVFETFDASDARSKFTMADFVQIFVEKLGGVKLAEPNAADAGSAASACDEQVSTLFDSTAPDAVHHVLSHNKGIGPMLKMKSMYTPKLITSTTTAPWHPKSRVGWEIE